MSEAKSQFFSVKHSTNIGSARYIPSVCYRVTQDVQAAVTKMAADGSAKLYAEEVRFVTGVPYPVKKPQPPARPSFVPSAQSASGTVSAAETDKAGKSGKAGNRKSGFVGQREFT